MRKFPERSCVSAVPTTRVVLRDCNENDNKQLVDIRKALRKRLQIWLRFPQVSNNFNGQTKPYLPTWNFPVAKLTICLFVWSGWHSASSGCGLNQNSNNKQDHYLKDKAALWPFRINFYLMKKASKSWSDKSAVIMMPNALSNKIVGNIVFYAN